MASILVEKGVASSQSAYRLVGGLSGSVSQNVIANTSRLEKEQQGFSKAMSSNSQSMGAGLVRQTRFDLQVKKIVKNYLR